MITSIATSLARVEMWWDGLKNTPKALLFFAGCWVIWTTIVLLFSLQGWPWAVVGAVGGLAAGRYCHRKWPPEWMNGKGR